MRTTIVLDLMILIKLFLFLKDCQWHLPGESPVLTGYRSNLLKGLGYYIITMETSNHFGEGKDDDPYWEFDRKSHFRPLLSKGDFFKLTGFPFGYFIDAPITKFIKDPDHVIERARHLSYGQKALFYWLIVDSEVRNGGLVQFYYNGNGPYIPTIVKSLQFIGDKTTADLISRADKIYQASKHLMDEERNKNLFESDLYDELDELSYLDDEHDATRDATMANLERYIKTHPNEFCLDENGEEIDVTFSGDCLTFYPDKQVRDIFTLDRGAVTGEFKSYFENGTLKERIQFLDGTKTGELEEFFENGTLKYRVVKNSATNQFRHEWYYENANPQKLEHKRIDRDERIGEYKEWYNNGQLHLAGTYISAYDRDGEWLEYHSDGSKKKEAEFKDGQYLIHNYWNEQGEQTLKNGTGYYAGYGLEECYKNYKLHGPRKSFMNGVLISYEEMEDGIAHGYYRSYYSNGKLKVENIYEHGQCVSQKYFHKSEHPVGRVTFQYLMKDEWLKEKELPTADTYPACINEDEIKRVIQTPSILFEPEYQDTEGSTCLWLSVSEKGDVTNVKFSSSYMTIGDEFIEVADKMKFKPATKDGKDVPSFIYIIANFGIE